MWTSRQSVPEEGDAERRRRSGSGTTEGVRSLNPNEGLLFRAMRELWKRRKGGDSGTRSSPASDADAAQAKPEKWVRLDPDAKVERSEREETFESREGKP